MNTVICAAFQNVELTKLTYESFLKNSEADSRLILVNNGSTDGTGEWMARLDESLLSSAGTSGFGGRDGFSWDAFGSGGSVVLSKSVENKGCGIGRNVGLRIMAAIEDAFRSSSDYITFIDNDVVLTKGWDTEMIKFMDTHPEVGIIGPVCNFAGTPQLLDKVKYAKIGHPLPEKLEDIEPFAQWFRETHRGRWSYVPTGFVIIGFCMMIRKKCFDQLRYPNGSLFDEKFKYYGKEDSDLCVRATQAGWKLAYFGGCYVHHWGSKSLDALAKAGVDWGAHWRENDKVFAEKWK